MEMCDEFPVVLLPQLEELRRSDVREHRGRLALPADRLALLADVITGTRKLEPYTALDIHLFCLKKIFPEDYDSASPIRHSYSSSEFYEFDPAKNGQNLMKHGISFSEVVSFSRNFGALFVPCPDPRDSERLVIFSDLTVDSGYDLDVPLESFNRGEKFYTLSIAQQREKRFRFISSRQFTRDSYMKAMEQSFKGIYEANPQERERFVTRCAEVLEEDLFVSGQPPLRMIRPAT